MQKWTVRHIQSTIALYLPVRNEVIYALQIYLKHIFCNGAFRLNDPPKMVYRSTLRDSEEGNVIWGDRIELDDYKTVNHFQELLDVFEKDELSEFLYDDEWNPILK